MGISKTGNAHSFFVIEFKFKEVKGAKKMIDRLITQIEATKNPTVVGLDPTYSMIPSFIKEIGRAHV